MHPNLMATEPPADLPPIDETQERRKMITLREAADLCTVDYETFRRWVRNGAIPHVVVGPCRLKRVYLRDVHKLIREA